MLPLWIVKFGSAVTRDGNGELAKTRLSDLVAQCVALRQQNLARVAIVSSGAVAAGRGVLNGRASDDEVTDRQVCAALGQTELVNFYSEAFGAHGQLVAQVLATREDFATRRHYLNMRTCLRALLDRDIVPVINENDVVAVTELMFTDNDELAALVAGMLGADRLLLLSNVDGVHQGEPGSSGIISEWTASSEATIQPGTAGRFGRGGIHSKIASAQRAATLGTACWIANGLRPGILQAIAQDSALGTHFAAASRPSEAKRWVGSAPTGKARVVVNRGAADALRDPSKLASLLPVGIVDLSAGFARGDIVRIETDAGELLGFGRAEYDADEAMAVKGKQQQKPLIHYNYLHVLDHEAS